jgi:hypothetical protein
LQVLHKEIRAKRNRNFLVTFIARVKAIHSGPSQRIFPDLNGG